MGIRTHPGCRISDMVGIFEILQPERSETILASLLDVWRESVRASHRFLTEKDILNLVKIPNRSAKL